MTPVLEARDLYRFYHAGEEETLALRGVSMRLDAGETVAIMGPSGSGKSTLLACLAGLDEPDGGHVELIGRRLTRRPEPERAALRATHIGILLQSGNLIPHLSVAENVRLPMHLARHVDERRVGELLSAVGLGHRRHALPTQLSGGEVARAGLAVALAVSPPVLLADEPTGEVDAETEAEDPAAPGAPPRHGRFNAHRYPQRGARGACRPDRAAAGWEGPRCMRRSSAPAISGGAMRSAASPPWRSHPPPAR